MTDKAEYHRASHAVWEAMAAGWDERHDYIESSARPVTEAMVRALAPEPGDTVLDIAAGTGVAGFAASPLVGDGGLVIVSDFSTAMVAAAARHAGQLGLGNVETRVLDALDLDLDDEAVDGVLCRWGYMLMPDPAVALAETRRVLRSGGRLSLAVFGAAEENPWAALPARVLARRGHLPANAAWSPGILALSDPARLEELLVAAGFSEVRIDAVEFTWRYADADAYWTFIVRAAGALAMVIGRLDPAERDAVRAEVAEGLASAEPADGFELPALSLVASAT